MLQEHNTHVLLQAYKFLPETFHTGFSSVLMLSLIHIFWICGGADLVNQLIKSRLISRFHISVIPVILGNGIRLFHEGNPANQLKLISADNLHGMTDLVYETCE